MIIDTNGFEVGDNLFAIFKSAFSGKNCFSVCFRIESFRCYKDKIVAISDYGVNCNIKSLYKSEQECQLACDRLNGINHD